MPKQSLLVADADPRSLRIAEVALRRAGFAVATASDGAEALRRIQRAGPDLVLADLALPTQDGVALCRAVRGDPRLAGLPFLVMSADRNPQSRARAMEAGADEFVEKPLLVKELVGRVRMLLSRRERARFSGRAPAALNGTVADLGLVDLFSSLEGWQKSAIVVCEDEAKVARVWVRDGQVIDVEVEGLVGDAAFYRLLSWEGGVFRVEFGPVDRAGRIRAGTQALLLEAMRRMDEAGRLAEVLPPSVVLQVDIAALAQRLADLPDEVNGILRLVDGRKSLREIVAVSPLDDLSTLAVVQRLLGDHVLRRAGKATVARAKPSLSEWLRPEGAVASAAADAPPDAAELLLPDDPPLAAAEAGERAAPRSGAAAAPIVEAGRGVVLGRYTPARGASRAADAQPNGMALRLTDMLDLPTESSGKEPAPARRRGADAPGESEEKSRVRWSEIAETPPAHSTKAAPSSALDPSHFEEGKRRVPAPETRAAAPELPRPVPADIQARRPWPWIVVGVVCAAGAAGLFLRRSPVSTPVATANIAPRAAGSADVPAPAPSLADGSAAPVASSDGGPSGAPPSAEEFGRALSSGQALLKRGRYRAAVGELRKAVDIQPESVPALVALGDAFLQADQARSALGPLQKATQLDRKNGRAQLLLGTAHQTLGHKPDAMKAYRRYLELEPRGEFAGDVRSIVATLGK